MLQTRFNDFSQNVDWHVDTTEYSTGYFDEERIKICIFFTKSEELLLTEPDDEQQEQIFIFDYLPLPKSSNSSSTFHSSFFYIFLLDFIPKQELLKHQKEETTKNYPMIKSKDPVVMFFGAKPGDVIKTTRKNGHVMYRKVVL